MKVDTYKIMCAKRIIQRSKNLNDTKAAIEDRYIRQLATLAIRDQRKKPKNPA